MLEKLKVKLKTPEFWGNLSASLLVPEFAFLGLNWTGVTSFSGLVMVLLKGVQNPVVLITVAVLVAATVFAPSKWAVALMRKMPVFKKLPGIGTDAM